MKILELRDADGPGGGPEKTILHGAGLADTSRFDITVCYLRRQWDQDQTISSRAAKLGINYTELRQSSRWDRGLWRNLREFVQRERFDIVHSHDYKSDFYNLMLAKREGTIPLATAHGWTGHSRRERWIYYPLEKISLRTFPIVICVSSDIATALRKYSITEDKLRIIPNGIDPDQYRRDAAQLKVNRERWGCQNEEYVIGSVGRLEPQKRFDLLIESFAPIHREFPRTRLLIAGEGSQRQSLQSLVDRLHLSDVCRLVGHCSQITQFYQALDLYVQSSDYEGTPNVVLEAMAMEVPVVATDAGGTSDILTNGTDGIIVPIRDAESLTKAIGLCLNQPELTRNRVLSARKKVESDLNFVNRVRRVEQIYESLYCDRYLQATRELLVKQAPT
ncbi:MAG: glycosyltransferase [Planctomycetaceae bacterium]